MLRIFSPNFSVEDLRSAAVDLEECSVEVCHNVVHQKPERFIMFTKSPWRTSTEEKFPSSPFKNLSFALSAMAVEERKALSRSARVVMDTE